MSTSPSRRASWKSVRLVWKRTELPMCSKWVLPKKSPLSETEPWTSAMSVSRQLPSRVREPVTPRASKEEPRLLMWVMTEPPMALTSTSPWLEVMVTGALRVLTWTLPWSAVTVAPAVLGRVMVRSARAPSTLGTLRDMTRPEVVRVGERRAGLVGGVGVGAG